MGAKKPLFYKSAERAVQNFNTSRSMALVAVKLVSTHMSYGDSCYKDWDTEYYPEYIVVLHD
jgi:hypothetical protein